MTCETSARTVRDAMDQAQRVIAPLWPLKDYVAVNPFLGSAEREFLTARQYLRAVCDIEMLLPMTYFQERFSAGQLYLQDLQEAIAECRQAYPSWFHDMSAEELHFHLTSPNRAPAEVSSDRRFWTMSERIDRDEGTTWSTTIVNEISRHCAAHFDQGQAIWASPWKQLPLYEAWRESAHVDLRMEKLGISGFRRFVDDLPADAEQCVEKLIQRLGIPEEDWEHLLLCELFSIPGWASYCKYRERDASARGSSSEELLGLLAIRLAYDTALATASGEIHRACQSSLSGLRFWDELPSRDALRRYALQVAAEAAYRRDLCAKITLDSPKTRSARPLAQMVFCIDVRSEVIRRSLESVTDQVETFGFAGFFGVPIEHIPLGASSGSANCPVLLSPSFRVEESICGASEHQEKQTIDQRHSLRLWRRVWKYFRGSAATCFSFVESLGLAYAAGLVRDSFALSRSHDDGRFDGISKTQRAKVGPKLNPHGDRGIDLASRVQLAQGILRNLGLCKDFAPLVVLCGHASETANNPYRAGLDCGACGGHSGEFNAQVAAAILNDGEVRRLLIDQGIQIPADVHFVAAVHNTTTDDIHFFDPDSTCSMQLEAFQRLTNWTAQASRLARHERGLRMNVRTEEDVIKRSRDWAEVRPEWGLAGNAAFIVASRSRTVGSDLKGRTFLHNYDHNRDSDWKTLELIMTAPMIVTNWINLQYYASTVDNRAFGSGNKTIHNVVGNFGVLQGNGGDLMTGLPWQSVHDGKQFQHEPLRLLVVIEAPRSAIQAIVDKHPVVRDLACHGWLSVLALDDDKFYRFSANGSWQEMPLREHSLDRVLGATFDGDVVGQGVCVPSIR